MPVVVSAQRCPPRQLPRPQTEIARQGLRFQRRVETALRKAVTPGFEVESTPWFLYQTGDTLDRACAPDILLRDLENATAFVVEVKLSWVPNVLRKLRELYCPVVSAALGLPVNPLVVAKNSGPDAPPAAYRLIDALSSEEPFLLWPGDGPILL